MTVNELSVLNRSELKVLSGYNGIVLCKSFDPKKHIKIGEREVLSIWAECRTNKNMSFGNIAIPIICVYVSGAEEREKEKNALAERNKL